MNAEPHQGPICNYDLKCNNNLKCNLKKVTKPVSTSRYILGFTTFFIPFQVVVTFWDIVTNRALRSLNYHV